MCGQRRGQNDDKDGRRRRLTLVWIHLTQHSFSYPCFFHLAIKLQPREERGERGQHRVGDAGRTGRPKGRGERELGGGGLCGAHFASAYPSLSSQSYNGFSIASRT